MPHKPIITQPDDTTVVIERTFDAPRQLVWDCWTRAEHIAKWFGPHGMAVPEARSDLRPGGEWRIVMRDPNGADYTGKGIYREVQAPERFTATVDVSEHPDAWFDVID
ncbi:MAG: SRPBCC domain-containing protein, partial [Pseudolabrys sp.]|nr:SRPBCC domain-containing protein [Pseudolabrys sp.]